MFTGLIETTGVIEKLTRGNGICLMTIRAPKIAGELVYGQSVCVSGACLTVTSSNSVTFTVDITDETLARTKFKSASSGDLVNLERAMKLSDRLDGHIVSGHIDSLAITTQVSRTGNSMEIEFEIPEELASYVVTKGSVALDGICLTVANAEANRFTVALIPVTIADTTIGEILPGAPFNLEVDVIGRYVEKMFKAYGSSNENIKRETQLNSKRLSELGW